MLHDHKLARDRAREYLENCIAPARFQDVSQLDVAVSLCDASHVLADDAVFTPVQLGYSWGPLWSTAWFNMRGELPEGVSTEEIHARIDTNTEACVWWRGVPYHGLSCNHKAVPLDASFFNGRGVELSVEAAANQLFGTFSHQPRYPDEPIGLLTEARLVRRLPAMDALYHDMDFALKLADELEHDDPRRRKLIYALNETVNALDPHDLTATADRARAALAPVLAAPAHASAGRCCATGHAHIDAAWLWPIRETRRKCYRTFSTVLRHMERYPEYRFQQGQAQLYAFVEEGQPELFDAIRERVKEGRWDAGGAMWVEPDCNLVSGESLVRQILHGASYWREKFGVEQSYLWLPDTFGYSAALPQILTHAGLRAFFTQKMSWNQFNRFPHHTFWWAGLDGTRILAHFLTADTYNADCTPKELRHGDRAFAQNDRCRDWLYAYGWGDGGGGPTTEMLEALSRSEDCEGMPRVAPTTVGEFVDTLHESARHLPIWDGELYLEYHRGTLTTQAANKRDNRRSELRLRDVEILCALHPDGLAGYPGAELDACWKKVLLNQFHDILPGSSIREVYEDSARDYADVSQRLVAMEHAGLAAWAAAADTSAADQPLVAVNTLGWSRSAVVEIPDTDAPGLQAGVDREGQPTRLALLEEVDGIGHRVFDLGDQPQTIAAVAPVTATDTSLENAWIRVAFDRAGRLTEIYDKRAGRALHRPGEPANQFMLYEDRPNSWDAWDVDLFYLEKGQALDDEASVAYVESGPLRAALKITRPVGAHSQLTQYVRLSCTSARIDFETQVDWNGDRELLRVLFPLDLRSSTASYHTQFGHIERPTHFNTSWDLAKFECCGHHWCDLSEPDYGAALLSDSKYGYSCHGHVLGLSLLRAPTSPNPQADRGEHRFTYSLFPHTGDLPRGGVIRAGYELNVPLRLMATERHTGPRGTRYTAMHCAAENVLIDTVKRAEDDDRIVVRLYEAFGQRGPTALHWDSQWGTAQAIDLLERPVATDRSAGSATKPVIASAPGSLEWSHRPFGLWTFAIG